MTSTNTLIMIMGTKKTAINPAIINTISPEE